MSAADYAATLSLLCCSGALFSWGLGLPFSDAFLTALGVFLAVEATKGG
jgi:hypothetical protein